MRTREYQADTVGAAGFICNACRARLASAPHGGRSVRSVGIGSQSQFRTELATSRSTQASRESSAELRGCFTQRSLCGVAIPKPPHGVARPFAGFAWVARNDRLRRQSGRRSRRNSFQHRVFQPSDSFAACLPRHPKLQDKWPASWVGPDALRGHVCLLPSRAAQEERRETSLPAGSTGICYVAHESLFAEPGPLEPSTHA
jgi:hypothetical protein